MTDTNNPYWLRHGEKILLGIAGANGGDANGSLNNKNWILWILRGFLGIKMDVCENGELPSEFEKGEKKLIPLIFLHGLSMNRTTNSGTCKDFCSHGYIVFTIDHEDGTSSYTKS